MASLCAKTRVLQLQATRSLTVVRPGIVFVRGFTITIHPVSKISSNLSNVGQLPCANKASSVGNNLSEIYSGRSIQSLHSSRLRALAVRWKHRGRIGNRLETLEEQLQEEQHATGKSAKKKKGKNAEHENFQSKDIKKLDNDNIIADFDAGLVDDDDKEEAENEELPQLPDVTILKQKMVRVVTHLENSLKSIRGGEPTPEMFENIMVMAYGTATPLSSVAQVVILSPTLAKCSCFDPENAKGVRDAIRDGGLNLNPRIDDPASGEVIVPVPKVSAETRQLLTKQIGKMGEASRTKIRNIRRRAHDICKKGQTGKLDGISKDDAFRISKEVESTTEQMIEQVNTVVDAKQSSVLAV